MTTDRTPRDPRRRASPLEVRAYLIALLAAIYTITWRVIGDRVPTPSAPDAAPPAPGVVWLDRLPPRARPAIVLPPGWQLATDAPATAAQQPVAATQRLTHLPTRRAPRVRTRSS